MIVYNEENLKKMCREELISVIEALQDRYIELKEFETKKQCRYDMYRVISPELVGELYCRGLGLSEIREQILDHFGFDVSITFLRNKLKIYKDFNHVHFCNEED